MLKTNLLRLGELLQLSLKSSLLRRESLNPFFQGIQLCLVLGLATLPSQRFLQKQKRSVYYSIYYKKYSRYSTTYFQQLESMLHLLSRQVTSRCDLGSTCHNHSPLGHFFNYSYSIPCDLGI